MLSAEGRLLHTYHAGRDVRAVDWLNPTTTVGGSARGDVFLWDTRTWGSSLRFRHPGPVTGIRNMGNGSQILVSGMESMCIYDVRMTTKTAKSAPKPQMTRQTHQHRNSTNNKRASNYNRNSSSSSSTATTTKPFSEPWLSIPSISKTPQSALDIWPEAKIVARRDDHNVIQLYSLLDGKHIRSLGEPDDARDKQWMRRMRFVEEKRGDVSLVTCQGAWLREWRYGGCADGECSDEDEDEEEQDEEEEE